MRADAPAAAGGGWARRPALLALLAAIVLLALLGAAGVGPFAAGSFAAAGRRGKGKGKGKGTGGVRAPPPPPSDGLPAIAGIYVYYRRPKAFLHSVAAFRAAYPTSTLVMVCDEGCFDYTRAAAHFGARDDGRVHQIVAKNVHAAFYIGPQQAKNFLAAYRDAVNGMAEPFFLQLEDDVHVLKRVASPLRHAINGWAPDKRVVGGAADYVRARNPGAPAELVLGGFGGSVYATAFWRAILNRPDIGAEVDALYAAGAAAAGGGHATYGIDYIMASLLYRFNGSLGTYDGYVESFEPRAAGMRAAGRVEVLHGFKELYSNHPLTWDERELLGPGYERVRPAA
jgi:hypothetical protein